MNYKSLTARQEKFVEQFLISLNASKAAIAAGYSPRSAAMQGERLMRKDAVREKIDAAKAVRAKDAGIDAAWLLQELHAVYRRCISEIKPATDRRGKALTDPDGNALFVFNAPSALKALELLGRHISVGAFEDRITLSPGMSLAERIQQGRQQARAEKMRDITPRAVAIPYQPKVIDNE